jgi:hypothetical protein
MIRGSGHARNLKSHRRTPVRMALRLLLAAAAWVASGSHGNAFTCFSSADSVRQENPTAWPSWTMRAAGHEGTKCWYASTRATAHDHRNPPTPTTDRIGSKEQLEREAELNRSAAPIDTVPALGRGLGSSFDDRFSAALEGRSPDAGALACAAYSGKGGEYTGREPGCEPVPRK